MRPVNWSKTISFNYAAEKGLISLGQCATLYGVRMSEIEFFLVMPGVVDVLIEPNVAAYPVFFRKTTIPRTRSRLTHA